MKWVKTGMLRTGEGKTKEFSHWSCLPEGHRSFVATICYSREHEFLSATTSCNCGTIDKERFKGKSIEEAQALVETLLRLEGLE